MQAKVARSEAESQARDLRTQLATAHASMSKMQAELDEEEDLRNKVAASMLDTSLCVQE